MLDRYLSENGQQLYQKRSHSAETYQGDLKQNGKFIHFLRRGLKKVKVDSTMTSCGTCDRFSTSHCLECLKENGDGLGMTLLWANGLINRPLKTNGWKMMSP